MANPVFAVLGTDIAGSCWAVAEGFLRAEVQDGRRQGEIGVVWRRHRRQGEEDWAAAREQSVVRVGLRSLSLLHSLAYPNVHCAVGGGIEHLRLQKS